MAPSGATLGAGDERRGLEREKETAELFLEHAILHARARFERAVLA